MNNETRDDFDSPWKEALERYFPEFVALFFPAIHAAIDWARGHVFLDKELQQVVRDAELGRRYADKRVQVYTLEGAERWVLIHVEVQGEPERGFAERMYVYHYRLFDRYRVDVVSLAVLADEMAGYRPGEYCRGRWGCEVAFRYPVAKVLDWRERWAELEGSANRFALDGAPEGAREQGRFGAERLEAAPGAVDVPARSGPGGHPGVVPGD